jgi:hypothetical protein
MAALSSRVIKAALRVDRPPSSRRSRTYNGQVAKAMMAAHAIGTRNSWSTKYDNSNRPPSSSPRIRPRGVKVVVVAPIAGEPSPC